MQVFPKSMNSVSRISVLGIPLLMAGTGVALSAFYRSDYTTGRNEIVEQPVPFSHLHHVSQLGIDCRYCHTGVETSAVAGLPPTKTCMNCHQQMWVGAELLEPVRNSFKTDIPIAWMLKIPLDLLEPQVRVVVGSIERRSGIDRHGYRGPLNSRLSRPVLARRAGDGQRDAGCGCPRAGPF